MIFRDWEVWCDWPNCQAALKFHGPLTFENVLDDARSQGWTLTFKGQDVAMIYQNYWDWTVLCPHCKPTPQTEEES